MTGTSASFLGMTTGRFAFNGSDRIRSIDAQTSNSLPRQGGISVPANENLLVPGLIGAGHRFMCFFVFVSGFLRRGTGWMAIV